MKMNRALLAAVTAALIAVNGLSACAPLLVGGAAVGGALIYVDRRTSGAQVEDEGIELKAGTRLKGALGDGSHFNVTSYNRIALVTGEVASEAERAKVDSVMAGIENLRSSVNETTVAGSSSFTSRSNDLIIVSKVKASMVDAKDIQASAYKVVVERGIVYLMGRVTEREAERGVAIARGVSGVQKVVRVFELISEEELKALTTSAAKKS